jgi:hypothetical protein
MASRRTGASSLSSRQAIGPCRGPGLSSGCRRGS